MVAIKPADADRILARPSPDTRVILIHGDDDGLVSERMAGFVTAVVGDSGDPFAHLRLEASQLADDPQRLADEAHAIPMFGGRRVISIRLAGNWSIVPALEPILAVPPVDSWIVIGAGELRKTSPVRRLLENDRRAAVIACYADSDRDLDRIIDEETKAAGLAIAADARSVLRALIGSDRLASRGEVRKLCLYAADKREIAVDDVQAIVGDAAAFATDEAVDAMALGEAAVLDRAYRRLIVSGTPGVVIAGAAIRHLQFLHRGRAAFDDGESAEAIIATARPPVFFKRRTAVTRQLSLWPVERIERALALLDQAMLDSRLRGSISDEVIGQALLAIAAAAAKRR